MIDGFRITKWTETRQASIIQSCQCDVVVNRASQTAYLKICGTRDLCLSSVVNH